jgi:hypothetical protein
MAVVAGGAQRLSAPKTEIIGRLAGLVRRLPEDDALLLAGLVEEFARDGYLERAG